MTEPVEEAVEAKPYVEEVAHAAHKAAGEGLEKLIASVQGAATASQLSLLLTGLADQFTAAVDLGPSVVRHLASELRAAAEKL